MKALLKRLQFKLAGLLLLFRIQPDLAAQTSAHNNFDEEINYYKNLDDTTTLPAHPILFIGSSSVKNWIGFDSTYAPYGAINRGFGGSTLLDQIHYANDIILNHDPRQIVIYCGENDFASSASVTPELVFDRFLQLYKIIRSKYPNVPVVCISMKPSPSKLEMMHKIYAYNNLLQEYIAVDPTITYADIFTPMLKPDGSPDRSYFFNDMLHMNRKGYQVWNSVVAPLLVE
jgi:lysophospholipase L1-like esterase